MIRTLRLLPLLLLTTILWAASPPVLDPAIEKADFATYQRALAVYLVDEDRNGTALAAVERPAYRLALAQHELIRLAGAPALAGFATGRQARPFLKAFLGNTDWLEEWLASGPLPTAGEHTIEGLGHLRDIWAADRTPAFDRHRSLATAVALCFSAEPTRKRLQPGLTHPRKPVTPVTRYTFYRDAHVAGRLQSLFDNLKTWELRFVVATAWGDDSLAWVLDHIDVPLWRYTDACWMCEYRGASAFGDTIQGPDFYLPWRDVNPAENTYRHGGVCGGLSTFGCTVAQAHGVPAYTCGQPGHCAYAVRTARKKWEGGFGGPGGSPHIHFWFPSWYAILLMEDMYGDDAAQIAAERHRWQAALHRERPAMARVALDAAVARVGIHWHAWQDLVDLQLADQAATPAAFMAMAQRITTAFKDHSRPMTDLLARLESRITNGMPDADKVAWLGGVHRAIAATGGPIAWDWDMEGLMARQAKLLGNDARWDLFRSAVTAHAGNAHLLGELLTWGEKTSAKGDARQYIEAATAALASAGAAMKDDALRTTFGSLVLAAAKTKSPDTFQAVADQAERFARKSDSVRLERPAGLTLVSGDGLFSASSTCGWDRPCEHRGVLREGGGSFHTDKEKTPSATVQLKKTATLTGILLVNTSGNQNRANPLKVSVSTDGATWKPIWESDRVQRQWFIDCAGKHIQAKWVKVESPHDEPEFLHLSHICVYGEGQ